MATESKKKSQINRLQLTSANSKLANLKRFTTQKPLLFTWECTEFYDFLNKNLLHYLMKFYLKKNMNSNEWKQKKLMKLIRLIFWRKFDINLLLNHAIEWFFFSKKNDPIFHSNIPNFRPNFEKCPGFCLAGVGHTNHHWYTFHSNTTFFSYKLISILCRFDWI